MSLLYNTWTRDELGPSRPSGHSDPPAQEGQGDFSPAAGDRPPGAGPSARSPSSDRSHGEASQGQMRAAEHIEGSDYSADSAAVEHGWDNSEDATWIKGIYHWRKEGRAASEGDWDPIVVNDGQVATYVEECARTPRHPKLESPTVLGLNTVDPSPSLSSPLNLMLLLLLLELSHKLNSPRSPSPHCFTSSASRTSHSRLHDFAYCRSAPEGGLVPTHDDFQLPGSSSVVTRKLVIVGVGCVDGSSGVQAR
ncbi:hypothetical protein BU15DRAFT_74121 [Melanogaster broomeanus]|nr:hypothetical protein BU15DRAFT_74121 [Melanogaster broomeanus]